MAKRGSDAKRLAEFCARTADGMKAEDITVMQVGELTTVADYFVVCAGNSTPHLRAISENVAQKAREELGRRPLMATGSPESGWMVLDFGPVIMHVFSKPAREKYDIEGLWNDAPRVEKTRKGRKTR